MNLVILPPALADLQSAASFYTKEANVKLGESFVAEFERSISVLFEHPLSGVIWRSGTRKFPLRRFPYNIIYQVTPELLRVVAIAHQSRRPGYWVSRR